MPTFDTKIPEFQIFFTISLAQFFTGSTVAFYHLGTAMNKYLHLYLITVDAGDKSAAELEAEMMDRALKESLDLVSVERESMDEDKMLERALKESLATASQDKVQ